MRNAAIAAFFLFASPLAAQPELRLKDALKAGLEQNFDIRLARNEVELARDGNTAGMAGFLPSVNLNLGTSLQSSNLRQKFASGLEVDRPGVGSTGLNGGISVNWLVFDGGKMFLTKKKLDRQLNAAEIRLQNQILGFADSLSAAYYQVVLAGLELKTLKQSLGNAEERLRLASEQQRIGTRPASDVLQAKMDLNQLKNRILSQQKQVEIRKGALNLMMGREPDLDFVPADTVQLPENLPFSQWKNKVLERNLNLRIQKENLEISKLTVGETKSGMLPQINLSSALNYQRSSSTAGFALFNRNVGPQAGLSLSMPLFSGVPVNRLVRMADREVQSREIQLKLTENRLLFQLWRGVKNLESYLESLETEKSTEQLARENLRLMQERFRMGTANSLEIREAESQLENAGIRLQQLKFQARIAGNQLLRLSAELDTEGGK
jgi:outer membrane protein TolC